MGRTVVPSNAILFHPLAVTVTSLQDERIWMNYSRPEKLNDYRYAGHCRRARERIRLRQVNWLTQLNAMGEREAMLLSLESKEKMGPSRR